MKSWKYNITITRCLDGDSYVAENFDLGMGVFLNKVTIRLFGCNTPESRSKNLLEKTAGLKAKEEVKFLHPKKIETVIVNSIKATLESSYDKILVDKETTSSELKTFPKIPFVSFCLYFSQYLQRYYTNKKPQNGDKTGDNPPQKNHLVTEVVFLR